MIHLIATLGLISSANAQDAATAYNAHGFALAPSDNDQKDLLTVWRPERQQSGSFGFEALFEASKQPLVADTYSADGKSTEIVLDQLYGVNLGLTYGISDHLGLSAAMPLWGSVSSERFESAPALGDLRLSVPVGLVLPKQGETGLGVALVPFLSVPTGDDERFLGTGELGGGANLALGYDGQGWQVSANAGLEETRAVSIENLQGGLFYRAALGGSVDLRDNLALRGEATLSSTVKEEVIENAETPTEILVSLRGRTKSDLVWTLGAAKSVIPGAGAADMRAFVGLGKTLGKQAPQDSMLNISANDVDDGPINAWLSFDEAPEAMGSRKIGDDGFESLTVAPGHYEVTARWNGVVKTRSVDIPEGKVGRIDFDFDLGPDEPDLTEATPVSNPNPCTDIVVLYDVNFGFNQSAPIGPNYRDIQEIARDLAGCKEVAIQIQGHTDAAGPLAYNEQLGKDRAENVAELLSRYNVDRSRLTTESFGERALLIADPSPEACRLPASYGLQPDPNLGDERCAVNRRVELHPVLDEGEAQRTVSAR